MHHAPDKNAIPLDPRAQYFDDLADRWDEVGQNPQETVKQVSRHAALLGLAAGEDVLEVGCGTGQISGWLAAQVMPGRLTAIDFAPSMLAQARGKGLAADFQLADVCQDSLGGSRYDVVLCFHSFPHFRDQAAGVRNLAGVLRERGRLVVMHLAGSAQINAFHDSVGGAVSGDHLPSEEQFTQLLGAVDLTIERLVDRDDLYFLQARRRSGTA